MYRNLEPVHLRIRELRASHRARSRDRRLSYIKIHTVSFIHSTVSFVLSTVRRAGSPPPGMRCANAGRVPSQAQAQVGFYHARLNDAAPAAVRTVDWDVRWYFQEELVVGASGCRRLRAARTGKRRDCNGHAPRSPDASGVYLHHAVSSAASPRAVDRGAVASTDDVLLRLVSLFLLAPIRRPPRIPPKRNTMNFKTICDTTAIIFQSTLTRAGS
ncbi:hypothetical protein B0H16DRAFT_1892229 [Mycena metata]|uniref:Uncharacterized protein n=1 Tax=Mycena metata TaxID=1033252 RepID=A0AAD7I6Z1_9AGAR|nr:hypothetical protein B0H16DRAFT_1892229 [Mycena metata]